MCCGGFGIKKLFLAAGVVATVLAVLTFTKMGSYARTAWSKARDGAAKQVPIEFEIERIKNEITQLIPDLKKNLSVVAEEMAAVERLEKDIATTKTNLEKQAGILRKMANDLKTSETSFIYEGKMIQREQVARKLALDYRSYGIAESELKTKEQVLEAKRRALAAAKEQLNSIKEQEQQLKLQVAELEAQVKTVRLAQCKSKFSIDDSRLSEIKRSIEDLRYRLVAEQNSTALEAEFFGNEFIGGLDKPAPQPITELANEVLQRLDGAKVVAEQK
jgi:peptidoglycan hydrolase CwlO-like protein